MAVLALAACTSTVPEPAPTATTTAPTASPTPIATETPPPVPGGWPLTGIDDGPVPEGPALSVKIENSAASRPQSGLEDADLVWEELVEGGITRFNAVYHSIVPEVLGPIRSVRPMDAAITGPVGGVFAFSGGQDPFIERIRDTGLQLVIDDDEDPGFYRVAYRPSPHNLYGSGPELLAQADAAQQDPPPHAFTRSADAASATAAEIGTPADRLRIELGVMAPGWTWDGSAVGRVGEGAWLRDERGVAQFSEDGDRLLATNVVVLRVDVVLTDFRDPVGERVPETVLTGTGDAVVATDGRVATATWSKGGPTDLLELTTSDGEPVELAPGTTWIELVPVDDGSVTY